MTQTPDLASMRRVVGMVADKWWLLALRGALLVLLGLYMMVTPGLSVVLFVTVLAVYAIFDGIIAIVAGIAGRVESRGWTIFRGVLMVLVGAAIIASPVVFGAVAGLTLVLFIAAAYIVGGVSEIFVAIRERKAIEGEGWMIFSGTLSVLFGIVLVAMPMLSFKVLIMMAGVAALIFGFVVLYCAFKLRKLKTSTAA